MGLNTLMFDGVNLSDEFNCKTASETVWNAPARDVDSYTVPGRNGTVQVDNERFENIDITYKCFCDRSDSTKADSLRAFLTSRKGYCRLEDGYHPGEYRLASFRSGIEFEISGETKLVFDCKPQRFIDLDPIAAEGGGRLVVDQSDLTSTYDQLTDKQKAITKKAWGENAFGKTYKRFQKTDSTHRNVTITASGDWTIIIRARDDDHLSIRTGSGNDSFTLGIDYRIIIDASAPITITLQGSVIYQLEATMTDVENPTLFDAKPLIIINPSGAFSGTIASLDGLSMTGNWTSSDISDVARIMIDCETYNAYAETTSGGVINFNKFVNIDSGFILSPGINRIGCGIDLTIDRRAFTI